LYKLNEITTGDLYMKTIFKKLAIGASLAVSVSAIASAPAHAGSLTGATIGGTAASDYLVYDSDATNTFIAPNTPANVQKVLDGNAANPTGNVELFASSEKSPLSPSSPLNSFQALTNFLGYNQVTTLSGEIGGKQISLTSLTATDWFGASAASVGTALTQATNTFQRLAAINSLYNPSNLATQWFSKTLSTYSLTANQALFNTFLLAGGFQRFSDPNISYVNQDDQTGLIKIGLAGHHDAATLLGLPSNPNLPLQVSELVKVAYNGGPVQYLYSYSATESGLTEKSDGKSHSGNYEVTIDGIPPKAVPEPSVMLGLLGVAGVFASQRKLKLRKA
jgi:hypothetical protein